MRAADGQHIHRPLQAFDQAIGGFLRHEQQPQRGAALAGGTEGRQDHIVNHLLPLSRCFNKKCVEAAGLRDEGNQRAVTRRQRAVDGARRVGAAGEGDAGQVRMFHQRRADGFAGAWQQMQHVIGLSRLAEQCHGGGGDARA